MKELFMAALEKLATGRAGRVFDLGHDEDGERWAAGMMEGAWFWWNVNEPYCDFGGPFDGPSPCLYDCWNHVDLECGPWRITDDLMGAVWAEQLRHESKKLGIWPQRIAWRGERHGLQLALGVDPPHPETFWRLGASTLSYPLGFTLEEAREALPGVARKLQGAESAHAKETVAAERSTG